MFDHEKLDAYRRAIGFISWATTILDEKPRRGRPSVVRHLEESSTSIALNIAEGNGKRSVADRVRYLEIARGSALECAACLDVLVVRQSLSSDVASTGKSTLVRIVSETKLIEGCSDHPGTGGDPGQNFGSRGRHVPPLDLPRRERRSSDPPPRPLIDHGSPPP